MEDRLRIGEFVLIQVALYVGFLTLMPAKEVVVMEGVDYTAGAAFCNVGTWGRPAREDTLDVVSATYGGSGAAPAREYRWIVLYRGGDTIRFARRAVGEREEP